MENLLFSGVPKFGHIIVIKCLDIGTAKKTINFPFETNGKLMVLGVRILKHFRVNPYFKDSTFHPLLSF